MTVATLLAAAGGQAGRPAPAAHRHGRDARQSGSARSAGSCRGVARISLRSRLVTAVAPDGPASPSGYDEPSAERCIWACSTPCRRSTTPASPCSPTTSCRFATDPWICLPARHRHHLRRARLPGVVRARAGSCGAARRGGRSTSEVTVDHLRDPVRRRGRGVPARRVGQPAAPSARSMPAARSSSGSSTGSSPAPPASTASTWARPTRRRLLITDVLMFIGGGSAGTAGGIKVTTFALLGVRDPRRDPRRTRPCTRSAAGCPPRSNARRSPSRWPASALVMAATVALLADHPASVWTRVLFEADLRVRHRRPVHRHHRRPAGRRAARADRADVPRPARARSRWPPHWPCASRNRRYELPEERPIVG